MDIQTLKVSEINPAVYNPRKDLQPGDPEYEKLRKSIVEFDMVEPLIWNKRTGNLVGGHQRLKILKSLGIGKVEVSVVDLDDTKEKALNLALNKISGEWDMPRLKDLLEELDIGDFDIEITGFDLKEIEDLMTQFHVPEEGLTDDDAIPETTESICRRGDLWELGNHRLLCGDATFKEDVEKLMGGQTVRLCHTDPPYGVDYANVMSGRENQKAEKWKDIKNDNLDNNALQELLESALSLTDAQVLFLWHSWRRVEVSLDAMKNCGWHPNCEIVWVKNALVFGRSDYQWRHECCIYAKKDGAGRQDDRKQTTVWEFNKEYKPNHPTQKPVGLFEIPLVNHTKIGDICYEPFAGSGSQVIACEKLGRRCFMMEIDEHYCDVIIKRFEDFTGKQAVRIDEANTETRNILS